MWFLVILNALAKNIIPLIRQKSFLEKTKKGGWARDVTTEGGSGGIPPGIHTYHHHLQKPERSSFHYRISLRVGGGYLPTMLYHQGLALTILISQSLSLEAFSSFATLAAKSGSLKRLSSFHTFSRHDLRISNKDAVGIHHNNMSLFIDADDDISVPVDIGLNGDDHSSIVDDAKLENNSPPPVGANNINGHGTILNGNENLSSSSSPPTTIKLESTTPPFPIVLWRFTRPHTIIGSAITIPSIFLTAAPTYQSFFTIRSLASLLYAVIPALFMNLYITGLNQMTDVEIDKINVSALMSLLIHFFSVIFFVNLCILMFMRLSETISTHG